MRSYNVLLALVALLVCVATDAPIVTLSSLPVTLSGVEGPLLVEHSAKSVVPSQWRTSTPLSVTGKELSMTGKELSVTGKRLRVTDKKLRVTSEELRGTLESALSQKSVSTQAAPLKSTKIGTQEWTTENLDVTKFQNGDIIREADSYEAWEKACIEGTPVWCYYNNDPVKNKSLGKLYNFWAVMDKRKLAPEGWHVPSDAEWDKLAEELGGNEKAGKSMKAVKGWKNGGNGDNQSGFNGVAGGYRSHEKPAYYGGPFFEAGTGGYFWSTTRYLVDNSFCRILSGKNEKLEKNSFVMTAGLSVRLVKD